MEIEIPKDEEVMAVLAELGERTTARRLCEELVARGHPIGKSQLAIQRTAERGKICINDDWTLSPIPEAELQAA